MGDVNYYDRRTFLSQGLKTVAAGAVIGSSASALLDACGSSSSATPTASANPNAGISHAKPRTGGQLVMGVTSETDGFDPTTNQWSPSGVCYARAVYDPLAAVATDGTIVPYLAQSITANADSTVWTITMRPGIKFHDGSSCDASAVKVNIDALVSSGLAGPDLTNIASTTVTNPLTLQVNMKAPWVPFDAHLAGEYQIGYVVEPRNLLSGKAQRHPVGTGPFVFQEWVPGSHFTATRNPHYWRSGLPYLDQVTFKPITESESLLNSLRSGVIDILRASDPVVLQGLQGTSGFVTIDDLHDTLEPSMNFIMLNTAVAPTSDIRVRQALAYGLDTPTYAKIINFGVIPVSTGPFVPGSPYYAPTGYPSFDLAKAKELVSAYERDKGPLTIQLGSVTGARALEADQLMAGMWSKAGIKVQINQVEESSFILNALQGKYQAYRWTQFAAVDPDINYPWWSIGTAGPVGQLALNFARNKDLLVQQALDSGRTSTDPAARALAYQSIARRFAVDLPYIWTDRNVWIASAKSNVENFNGPTAPDGTPVRGFDNGELYVGQIWRST